MYKGHVFVCFLGSCVVGALTRDCGWQDRQKLHSCKVNFRNFVKNLAVGQSRDPRAIMNAICSEAGKIRMMCYLDIFKRCPALIPPKNRVFSMGVNITANKGSLDTYCDLITGTCQNVFDCYKMSPRNPSLLLSSLDRQSLVKYVDKQEAFNEAKPYLVFQLMSDAICGRMRSLAMCMANELNKCIDKDDITAKLHDFMEQATPSIPDLKMMNFDELLYFLRNGCYYMPIGFATSECLQKQVMSSEFTTCHKNFSATYQTTTERKNCTAYDALSSCFSAHVEPMCGARVSRFMVRRTPILVDGISRRCVTQTSGGIKPLATSTMIFGVALAVLLL